MKGINVGDSDYSAVITKLKSLNPDLVYFGGYHAELGLLLRQAREQGLKRQFMGPEGVANKDLVAIAGPAIDGLLVTLPADFTKLPGNERFLRHFKNHKRSPDGAFTLTAYAAVQILADSIDAVGEDPTKVADYMHSNTFNTAIGKVEYDAKGDLKNFEFAVFKWDKDGEDRAIDRIASLSVLVLCRYRVGHFSFCHGPGCVHCQAGPPPEHLVYV